MLKRLYQFCLERLAVLEQELFQESREPGDVLKLKGRKAFRELARAFAFLTAGIKYIFFHFLLALTELAVLVFLSPKEGYELLMLSRHLESDHCHLEDPSGTRTCFCHPELVSGSEPDSDRCRNEFGMTSYEAKSRKIKYEAYEKKRKKARRHFPYPAFPI